MQFKQSGLENWKRSFSAKGQDDSITVKQVNPGVAYDARVRAVNQLGVRSQYQSLFGFTVDSPSGAQIRIDDGLITNAAADAEFMGLITDAVVAVNEEGEIL